MKYLSGIVILVLFILNIPAGLDFFQAVTENEVLDESINTDPIDLVEGDLYQFPVKEEDQLDDYEDTPFLIQGLDTTIDPEEVVDTSWTLGESINVTYGFTDHFILPETFTMTCTDPNDSMSVYAEWGFASSHADDSEYYKVTDYDDDDDDTATLTLSWQMEAFTSGVFYYNIFYGSILGSTTQDSSVALSEDYFDANGKISMSTHVINGNYYHFYVWNVSSGSATTIFGYFWSSGAWTSQEIRLDEVRFIQDPITSNIRSEYRQAETSGLLQKRLEVYNHEYQTEIVIDLPFDTDTSTIEVNPSVSTSLSGTELTLSDTHQTIYEITWLTTDDLRLIPASDVTTQVLNSSDFEDGNLDWNEGTSTFDSESLESGVVFGGSLAYSLADSDGSNDTIVSEYPAPNGTYFIHLAHYNKEWSGTGLVLSYYNETWYDRSLNTSTGRWIQEFFQIVIAGDDSGANLRLRFNAAQGEVIFDSFQFLAVNIEPKTTGFDSTRFRTQWRIFNGRLNPVAVSKFVDCTLEKYPSGTTVWTYDYEATDTHGIVEFNWYSRLYEEAYNLTSSYWDTTSAPTFNNGSVIFSPTTVSHGGYSWEFYGIDDGWEVTPASFGWQLDRGLLQDRSYDSYDEPETVSNPTGEGMIPLAGENGDYQELFESRGQTYRHWYNSTSQSYTYMNDYAVQKPGINQGTDWVTSGEYPVRFVIRNKAGSTVFCTLDQLVALFETYSNDSLWGIGIEGFGGIMAFYMNFEDSVDGNGQYLWYPRFINGSLAPYNFPQYQIYPHIYVQLGESIHDHFFIPTDTSRNRLYVENTTDELKLYYIFQEVYLDKTFQFRVGIKYNYTEHRFHNINHFTCLDGSFDDIGFAYEIDSTDMARVTSYKPERFILSNETHSVEVTIQEAWEAGTYLDDFYSQIEIVAENNEAWTLDFSDMELSGFTEKYLNHHDQLMPDGSTRRVLRAGMYGYGSYSAGTVIEIDPTFSEKQETDARDFCVRNEIPSGYKDYILLDQMLTGPRYAADEEHYRTLIAWDSGITSQIASTSAAVLTFYVLTNTLEAGEYIAAGVYDKGDTDELWDETEADADSGEGSWLQSMYWSDASFWLPVLGTNNTISDAKTGTLIDNWVTHHNSAPSSRQYIPIKLYEGTGTVSTDYISAYESTRATASQRPTLTFTYTVNTAPNAPTLAPDGDSGNTFAGKTHTFVTDHTDDDGDTNIDTMHLYYDDSSDFELRCPQSSASGSVTIVSGSDYLIGTPTYVHNTDPTDGYRVTWIIILDWDWSGDDTVYTVKAKTIDDSTADSGWATLDSDNTFENDIVIFSSCNFYLLAFPDGNYEGDGTTIAEGHGIKASSQVDVRGYVRYQGATGVSPNTDAFDVELSANAAGAGEDYDDDTLGADGYFDTPAFTVTSGTDSDYDFSILLTDPAAGSSFSSGSHWDTGGSIDFTKNSEVDSTGPSGATLTHADSDSDADGYPPQNGYDDDTVMGYTVSGAVDSDVGLANFPYSYRWNYPTGGWGSYTGSTTYSPTSSDGLTADADVQIRNKVGLVTAVDGEDVTCDTTHAVVSDPMSAYSEDSGDVGDVYGVIGTNTFYFSNSFLTSAIVTFTATMSDTNPYGINFGVFGEDPAIDTSSPYTGTYVIDNTDVSGSIAVVAVDMAGNPSSVSSITCTEIADAPTGLASPQCRPDGYGDTGEWDDDTTIYFTFTQATDGGSGVGVIHYCEIGDSDPDEIASGSGQDTDIGSDGLMTYYLKAVDNVGNPTSVLSDTISIDTINPLITGAVFTDDGVAPNWYDQGADSHATIRVSYTETNPDCVWITVTGITTYYDTSPGASYTDFNILITSESDGSYNIAFYVNDSVARSDSETGGSFGDAPLRLDNTGPISYSVTMASGVYYADKTNDMTPLLTVASASDGSGVGLHTTAYNIGWEVNEGGFTDVGYQAGATWSPSLSTDSSNYDFRAIVRDLLGNIGSYVYDDNNTVEDNPPTGLSIYQFSESSSYLYGTGSAFYYHNFGTGSHPFVVCVDATDVIAGLEKANFPNTVSAGGDNTTEVGGAYEYEWQYTADLPESFEGSVQVTVYDQCGNTNTVSFSVTQTDKGTTDEYYEFMVFPDSPMDFEIDLLDIDWRLYRDASISMYWNGSEDLEITVFWRGNNLTNWEYFGFGLNWRRINIDLTGTDGSENLRGEDGTFGFRFRNTAGDPTDIVQIKWARLEYKTFESSDSDWSWQQPGDYDSWTNGTDSLTDVGNSIIRVNATGSTNLLIYHNDTIDSTNYDLISIQCRASSATTLEFWNGTNHLLGTLSATTSWDNYLVWLNANWTGTQSDLLIVWPSASAADWFEINWLIMEEDTQVCVDITDQHLRFTSFNNSLRTRVRIDGLFIGDYWDLDDVPLNCSPGLHTVEYIAWYDAQDQPNDGYSIFIHSRGYYFTYTIAEAAIMKLIYHDQAGFILGFDRFKTFIDDTRLYDQYYYFEDTSGTFNLTITDLFDNQIYQDTTEEFENFKELQFTLYSVKCQNLQGYPVWLQIERGGQTFSEWIFSWEIVEYKLESDTYNFTFHYSTDSGFNISTNGTTVSYEYVISSDTALRISGYSIEDVFGNTVSLIDNLEDTNTSIWAAITLQSTNLTLQFIATNQNITFTLGNSSLIIDRLTANFTSIFTNFTTILGDLTLIHSDLASNFTEILGHVTLINSTYIDKFYEIYVDIIQISGNVTLSIDLLQALDVSFDGNMTLLINQLDTTYTHILANMSLMYIDINSNFTDMFADLVDISGNVTISIDLLEALDASFDGNMTILINSLNSNFTYILANLTIIKGNINSNFTDIFADLVQISGNVTLSVDLLQALDASFDGNMTIVINSLNSNFTQILANLTIIRGNLNSNFTQVFADLVNLSGNVTLSVDLMQALDVSFDGNMTIIINSLNSNFTQILANLTIIRGDLNSNFTAIFADLVDISGNVTWSVELLQTLDMSLDGNITLLINSLNSNFTYILANLTIIQGDLESNFTQIFADMVNISGNVTLSVELMQSLDTSFDGNMTLLISNLNTNFTYILANMSIINGTINSNFTAIFADLVNISGNVSISIGLMEALDVSFNGNMTLLISQLNSNTTQILADLAIIEGNINSNFTDVFASLVEISGNVTLTVDLLEAIDVNMEGNFTVFIDQLNANTTTILANLVTLGVEVYNVWNISQFIEDYVLYINSTMTSFVIYVGQLDLDDTIVNLHVVSTKNGTYYIYENNTFISSGSFLAKGTSITHARNLTANFIELAYKFYDESTVIWFNTSYSSGALALIVFHVDVYYHEKLDRAFAEIGTNYGDALVSIWSDASDPPTTVILSNQPEGVFSWAAPTDYTTYYVKVEVKRTITGVVYTFTFYLSFVKYNVINLDYEGVPANNSNVERDTGIEVIDWLNLGEIADWIIYQNNTLVATGTGALPTYTWVVTDSALSVWNFTCWVAGSGDTTNSSTIFFTLQDSVAPTLAFTGTTNNTYIEIGTEVTVSWTVSENCSYTLYRNGTIVDSGSHGTLLTNWWFYSYSWSTAGTTIDRYYNFTFSVVDSGSLTNTSLGWWYLRDTTPPVVIATRDEDKFTYSQTQNASVSWTIVDLCPGTYVITKMGTIVQSGSYANGELIIHTSVPLDSLTTYTYTLTAIDTSGSSHFDRTVIEVSAEPTPGKQDRTEITEEEEKKAAPFESPVAGAIGLIVIIGIVCLVYWVWSERKAEIKKKAKETGKRLEEESI